MLIKLQNKINLHLNNKPKHNNKKIKLILWKNQLLNKKVIFLVKIPQIGIINRANIILNSHLYHLYLFLQLYIPILLIML